MVVVTTSPVLAVCRGGETSTGSDVSTGCVSAGAALTLGAGALIVTDEETNALLPDVLVGCSSLAIEIVAMVEIAVTPAPADGHMAHSTATVNKMPTAVLLAISPRPIVSGGSAMTHCAWPISEGWRHVRS
jgi:hypothetical protein